MPKIIVPTSMSKISALNENDNSENDSFSYLNTESDT